MLLFFAAHIKPPSTTDALPYGTYHSEYRCKFVFHMSHADKRRLIGVGVLDVLPRCVSSVYFFYDPEFTSWELGRISALNEIALANRLHVREPGIQWYYLGA